MRVIKKRLSGSSVLTDMIPVVIALVITGMLGIWFAMWVAQFEQKEAVNSIIREYVLRMETAGCLNEDDQEQLLEELREHQVEEISLAGTTFTPVENGEQVILVMKGKMKVKTMQMRSIFQWDQNGSAYIPIEIERTATALY